MQKLAEATQDIQTLVKATTGPSKNFFRPRAGHPKTFQGHPGTFKNFLRPHAGHPNTFGGHPQDNQKLCEANPGTSINFLRQPPFKNFLRTHAGHPNTFKGAGRETPQRRARVVGVVGGAPAQPPGHPKTFSSRPGTFKNYVMPPQGHPKTF